MGSKSCMEQGSTREITRIYLAVPYSGRESHAFKTASEFSGVLFSEGYHVFSPVSHSHPIAVMGPEGLSEKDADFWLDFDLPLLHGWADELWVLMNEGWQRSYGVAKEIELAYRLGMPVRYTRYLGDGCYTVSDRPVG